MCCSRQDSCVDELRQCKQRIIAAENTNKIGCQYTDCDYGCRWLWPLLANTPQVGWLSLRVGGHLGEFSQGL